VDAIKAAAADKQNRPSVLCITWGAPESSYSLVARQEMDRACEAATDQGVTVLAAAGDNGVTDGVDDNRRHVDFPAADPWVLAVGGTKVTIVGNEIASEVVWNNQGGLGASGGGVSEVFALPEWQKAANVPSRADGSRGRGIPDVVAHASTDSGYQLFLDGQKVVLGGTTTSTPFWAGLIALINQGVGKNVGHLNQLLYKIPDSTGAFRHITKGNNTVGEVKGYEAGVGWTPVGGLGSPDGEKLLEAIKTQL
jgi:kumamolisin